MPEGPITGVVMHREATEELLMACATGLRDDFATTQAQEVAA